MLNFDTPFAQTTQAENELMERPLTLPKIFPTPLSVKPGTGSIKLGNSVVLVVPPGTNPEAVSLVRKTLTLAGVRNIVTKQRLPSDLDQTYIILGTGDASAVRSALERSDASLENQPEGYTIATVAMDGGALITLAGNDNDGLFYAAQTFRQLAQRQVVPALVIQDHPAMPVRGTIEGFYGTPWSMVDRTNHLEFLAKVKANTYVYSPKDDPYARDKWREPYPESMLKELSAVVATSQKNHVDFVYAISPGPTICFSDPADRQALERKFDALRSIGVTRFYVAFDDIEYTKWNCDQDEEAYGSSGPEAAGIAQSRLLNSIQAHLEAQDTQASPLIMVPTEYYNTQESPYKAALRENLNPEIVVQWTGTDVVPPAISVPDARAATKAFGRKTLLWDNYPVNDYFQTSGRLLLAPYARRESGLSEELTGILSNPMNQEAPSRLAVAGVAAFAWNDEDYDPDQTLLAVVNDMTGGDVRAREALLIFVDTQHLAPTFGSQPWQEQAPRLKARLDRVRAAIQYGDKAVRHQAIDNLVQFAAEFTGVPDVIRSGIVDSAFAEQSKPWLDAMQLWGRALQLTAAGLDAANKGNTAAHSYFESAKELVQEAAAIETIPGVTRFDGRIKIADGVLDEFIADAPKLILLNTRE